MAGTNDILEVAKMTINASIKCNTVRGFIGWHSCDNICMDMHDVLDMCEDAFKRERYQESLEADTYVLVSGVKLASCADSSSGMLTDVIMRAFELIDLSTQTIAKLDAAMRKHALSLIIKEAKKKAFDGWDSWRYELLGKAVCLCDEKLAVKLEKLLDVFLEDIENDYTPEYKRQEDTILRYKLHRHLKGADAVKDELYANLHIREIRIIAVKDATDARNYNEAEKLCLEQIKKEDGRFYRNIPEDWNNILFDVYVQSGITDKQIEQAKKILFLGNAGFWDVLKRLYQSLGTWESQKPIILKELKRSEKRENILNQKLEEKIPPKLQETLDTAFAKAFALIFEKGTRVIEKTYQRAKLEQDYQVRQYTADVKQNSKSLRSFSKKARDTGTKNLLLSGVAGIGMGVLGIGLPDIPVFTGMILKNIYETALQYGYSYETREEKYFILLLIRGAVSYGDTLCEIDGKVNEFIRNGMLPEEYQDKEQIEQTAGSLSKELLYMKFLQGIPVVGAVGGAYDAVYMKRITEYAELKYRHRYLAGRKKAENKLLF